MWHHRWKSIQGFLFTFNTNHVSILHCFRVIVHLGFLTFGLTLTFHPRSNVTSSIESSYRVVSNTNHATILQCFHVIVHLRFVTLGLTLTFHPRSNVTSPKESPYGVSYSCPIQTMCLSLTVSMLWHLQILWRLVTSYLTLILFSMSICIPQFKRPRLITFCVKLHLAVLQRSSDGKQVLQNVLAGCP